MPCRDQNIDDEIRVEQMRAIERERDDLVTMLCMAMRVIQDNRLLDKVHARARYWWRKHKKEDLEREMALKREQQKQEERNALNAKLRKTFTKKELKQLGIDLD
jgi:uncharacterized protein YaiL (DUF2058 family)